MENIFDILKEFNDLDTTIKRESFFEEGLRNRWNQISFNAEIEDLIATHIYAFPISEANVKSEQLIFIRYHNDLFLKKINRYTISKKGTVNEIRRKSRFDKIKGVAVLESISPIISLRLIRLDN